MMIHKVGQIMLYVKDQEEAVQCIMNRAGMKAL